MEVVCLDLEGVLVPEIWINFTKSKKKMTKAFNWQQVFKVLGVLLITEALFMMLAAWVSYIYDGNDLEPIIESAIITTLAGISGVLIGGNSTKHFGTREGYLLVG